MSAKGLGFAEPDDGGKEVSVLIGEAEARGPAGPVKASA